MGTTPVKLNNATDTWVYEYTPTTAKGTTGALLYVSNTATKRCNSYLYFTLPFPRGVTIISAKLRLTQYTATTGSPSISVARTATAWSATKLTWNTRPATAGTPVAVSKSNPAHATVWEWDVSALLQGVSSGAPWYGFVVYTTFNGMPRFYSPQSTYLNYRPVLEVSWKENPQKPTELYPSNGRAVSLTKPVLRTNFLDLSGDTTMSAINVRIFDSEALAIANTAPTWDSGTVNSSVPELDLAALTATVAVSSVSVGFDSFTIPANGMGLVTGTPVVFSGTTAPTGITFGTTYYVGSVTTVGAGSTQDFNVTTTPGGPTPVDLTTTGTAVSVARVPTWAGAAADSVKWWRVRVQDGSGLWSDWSNYTSFTVKTKGTLTITNPAATTVSDASLPITWTFTGRTQKAYQVLVQAVSTGKITYDSGKITSTALAATLGDKSMPDSSQQYKITLRVWDTIDREGIAGDPAYVEQSVTVTYVFSATVAAATGLTGTLDPLYPWITLNWSRSVMPDKWTIYRDGVAVLTDEGVNLFVSGTAYTWTDRLADPRIQHTWTVVSVVNGVGSASSPSVQNTITPITTCIAQSDGNNPVLIFDPSVDMGLSESSGVFQPAGYAPPVLITQSEHGYQGSIKGKLVGPEAAVASLTARQWRDRFNQLKKNNGVKLLLTVLDVSIECFIVNASVRPFAFAPGVIQYYVEFDFYQTDWTEVS